MGEFEDFKENILSTQKEYLDIPGGIKLEKELIVNHLRNRNNRLARRWAKKSGSEYEVEVKTPTFSYIMDPFSGNKVAYPDQKVIKVKRHPSKDYRRKFTEGEACAIVAGKAGKTYLVGTGTILDGPVGGGVKDKRPTTRGTYNTYYPVLYKVLVGSEEVMLPSDNLIKVSQID